MKFKAKALKAHKVLGSLLMLPLLWTTISGVAFTLVKEIGGNKALGKAILHLHTLETFGLHKIYPLILGISVLATLATAIMLMWKSKR